MAARIWNLIDGTLTIDQVVDALVDEYDVNREQAAADTAELVSNLVEVSLLLQVK